MDKFSTFSEPEEHATLFGSSKPEEKKETATSIATNTTSNILGRHHVSEAPAMSSSSYNNAGRVNVSQYLRNLNVQGPSVEENLTDEDLEKDLALFTNTQFFDFETGQHTDYQAPPVKSEVTRSPTEDVTSESIMGDFPAGYEFPVSGVFIVYVVLTFLFLPFSGVFHASPSRFNHIAMVYFS